MGAKPKKKKKRGAAGSRSSGPAAAQAPAAAVLRPPASNFTEAKRQATEAARGSGRKQKTVQEKRAEKAAQRDAEREKNPVGRPEEFEKVEVLLPILLRCAEAGCTNLQMASIAQISEKVWYNYQKRHPEFVQAIKKAKENADDRVEHALFERATGYHHPEDKIFYDAQVGKEVIVPSEKYYPPDTAAIMAWLTNRRRETWKHRQTVLHGGEIKAKVVRVNLPTKQAKVK